MNEQENVFDELRNVEIKKPTALTVKRPIGILRYNAEVMRDNGASQKDIEDYLYENGADIDLIMGVPSPQEHEVMRMVESEQSGKWAEMQKRSQELAERSQKSKDRLETLQGIQGGVRAFGNGLFLNYGDEIESAMTGQDVNQIREEQADWSARNPYWDLGLGLAGGMAPLLATGAGGALATGGAAGKSALVRTGLGAAYGAGTGALAGFGGGTDGFMNRLEGAGYGSLYGAGIGAAMPLAIGGVGRATQRIIRGLGKAPTEKQIGDFMVDNVIAGAGKPGGQAQRDASALLQAIQDGDTAIQDAAKNLNNKMLAIDLQNKPGIIDLAEHPIWTAETPSTQKIVNALTTPSKKAASEKFGQFVAQQPQEKVPGLSLKDFFKQNPVAKTIVRANKRRVGYNRSPNELTTYSGLQKIEDTLNKNLPKSLDSSRAVNRNAKILDAIDDLSNLREGLYPGQKVMDAKYRASVGGVQPIAERNAKAYMQQLASGTVNPVNAEVSLTGAAKLGVKPYVRGKARELILKGVLEPDSSSTIENILQKAGFNLYRTLEQQN